MQGSREKNVWSTDPRGKSVGLHYSTLTLSAVQAHSKHLSLILNHLKLVSIIPCFLDPSSNFLLDLIFQIPSTAPHMVLFQIFHVPVNTLLHKLDCVYVYIFSMCSSQINAIIQL